MALGKLIRKFKNLAADPPFIILQIILDKITFRAFQVRQFYLLEFSGLPEPARAPGPGVVRKGDASDSEEMAGLEKSNKKHLFRERFTRGDHCAVAVLNGQIVGYEWFSARASHQESRYRYMIPIPRNTIYAYDAYIIPEYRFCGIWVKFQKHLRELMKELDRNRIITLIDAGNTPSLNTHTRFGYSICKTVILIKAFSMRYFLEKKMRESALNAKRFP